MTFSENLVRLRKASGLTQTQVAAGAGISWRGYQNYELNLREPLMHTLVALADFYHITVDELICHEKK